jgi:hypothetical protein
MNFASGPTKEFLFSPPLSLLPSIARRGRRGRPVWAAVVAGGGGADGHGVAGHSHGPPHLGQRWPVGCWPRAPTAGWERSLAAVWLGYRAVSAAKGLGGGAQVGEDAAVKLQRPQRGRSSPGCGAQRSIHGGLRALGQRAR